MQLLSCGLWIYIFSVGDGVYLYTAGSITNQQCSTIFYWSCCSRSDCLPACSLFCVSVFYDKLFVCRMRLTPADVDNVINVAAEFINNVCSSFDSDETDLHCKDDAVAHHAVQRSVELLTEYLRLLRNACADCSCHQSVIQTWAISHDFAVH